MTEILKLEDGLLYRNIAAMEEGWLCRNTEAGGERSVQKYGRRVGCTKIWKKGWLYRNMEAWGGMAIQKYRSMRRDDCK